MSTDKEQGVSDRDIEKWFKAWTVGHNQAERMRAVREKARSLAKAIKTHVPAGPDQMAAIHRLREVTWIANGAIAIEKAGEP